MHPAYSVLFFTTLSGAGYGLLIWLAFAVAWGSIVPGEGPGLVMLLLGLVLVTAGLLSSTLHLGRPERAIRAFSQWRSSWLSREGVAAVASYVPAVLLGLFWFQFPYDDKGYDLLGLLLAAACLVTVWCTGMIYGSLPTIAAWSHPLVAPGYVVLALLTGGLLFVAVREFGGVREHADTLLAIAILLGGWALKSAYWSAIDNDEKDLTPADAIGLRGMGEVRVLEQAHTQPNFVMREMGYTVARKHATRLRQICVFALFIFPLLALLLTLVASGAAAAVLVLVAVCCAAVGIFVERWLFFAEAQHVVTLYYGAKAA